jgi:hypothetical protein
MDRQTVTVLRTEVGMVARPPGAAPRWMWRAEIRREDGRPGWLEGEGAAVIEPVALACQHGAPLVLSLDPETGMVANATVVYRNKNTLAVEAIRTADR